MGSRNRDFNAVIVTPLREEYSLLIYTLVEENKAL